MSTPEDPDTEYHGETDQPETIQHEAAEHRTAEHQTAEHQTAEHRTTEYGTTEQESSATQQVPVGAGHGWSAPAGGPTDPPTQPHAPMPAGGPGGPGGPRGPSGPGGMGMPAGMSGPGGPFAAPPAAPSREGLGTAALVLGIIGLVRAFSVVGGLVLGGLAVILGLVARGRVRRGEAFNSGVTTAGIILGAIAVVIAVVVAIWVGTHFSELTGGAGAHGTLQQCVRQANGDRAAVRQCRQQFGGAARGGAGAHGAGGARHRPGAATPAPQGT